jgi:ribosomal protein S18 acetylase RimI-like enzyme
MDTVAIHRATIDDIPHIEAIARQYPTELAFVRRVALIRGVEHQTLHIATVESVIAGFVLFNNRADGVSVVYDMATHQDYKRRGVGRMLLHSVPAPIRLKTTLDNTPAQAFYESVGMKKIGIHQGRKRELVEYEMKTLVIFCAGNNEKHPQIAYDAGMNYGVAQNDKPKAQPFMFDVEFEPEKQDWTDFMHKVSEYKPVMVVITDYQHESERDRLYEQIRDIESLGVLRIVCVPKFEGAINDIPDGCIIGISAPAKSEKFKGYRLSWQDSASLKGRMVHILGGSPFVQATEIDRVRLYGGRVISVDGNSIQKASTTGVVLKDGRWFRYTDGQTWHAGDYYETLAYNAKAYQQYINTPAEWLMMNGELSKKRIKARQLRLFD